MSDGTKIEWTDATWNVVNGCMVTSPGCTNCYAMKQAHRFEPRRGLSVPSKGGMVWTGEVRFNEQVYLQPLKWKRPRKVFVCAHGDLFYEKVTDEQIDRVVAVMALANHHTFQVLTKRPERMREYFGNRDLGTRLIPAIAQAQPSTLWNGNVFQAQWELANKGFLPNVWLGVSTEDQQRADERIPILLDTPAAKRWLSMEPLLGPVNLGAWLDPCTPAGVAPHDFNPEIGIDWIVVGGESGPGARPMHPDWARGIRDQCAAAGVPFLFKQWGDWLGGGPDGFKASNCRGLKNWGDERFSVLVGKKAAGRELDGQLHDGYPA